MNIQDEQRRDEALKKFLEADRVWIEARSQTRELSRQETEARNRESAAFKEREKAEEEFVKLFDIRGKEPTRTVWRDPNDPNRPRK